MIHSLVLQVLLVLVVIRFVIMNFRECVREKKSCRMKGNSCCTTVSHTISIHIILVIVDVVLKHQHKFVYDYDYDYTCKRINNNNAKINNKKLFVTETKSLISFQYIRTLKMTFTKAYD